VEIWESFDEDWARLPHDVQVVLASFLEKLQRNPYDPDIQKQAAIGDSERFAYQFSKGYVLYWRVDCESLSISIDKIDVTITLLGLGHDPVQH
jgi:mRNA-degrading endonuclease RelE of RelBE toxin-antitoxin system